MLFTKYLCFCFVESLTADFIIARVESKGVDIGISFLG